MSRGINRVTLVGNLGADPEIAYMPSGAAVATISIATSSSWTDKDSGEKQERTEWHRVIIYGKLAEITAEYCRKGSQVYVEGELRTDKYIDKQTGEDRYSTNVIAGKLEMLGTKPVSQGEPASASEKATAPEEDVPALEVS